jgi:hypothetical protein
MCKLLRACKSFALAALALATTALSGIIFSAKSEQEVCIRLNEALAQASPSGITRIFVDVDDTIISHGSDYDSFRKTGTFAQMKTANESLIQWLRELRNHPFVKTAALTSARAWAPVELNGETTILDTVPLAFPGDGAIFISKVRADAMEFLGLPFKTALETPVRKLPFVTQPVTLSDEIRANLRPLALAPELQGERYFSDSVFLYIRRVPFRMSKCELYTKTPLGAMEDFGAMGDLVPVSEYAKIIGWPVYENGVIFSNFFDEDDGLQKGLVMRSFLRAAEQDGSGLPTTIIAIDDNLFMLQNMKQVADELGIAFFGIHYQPPRPATFWMFGPPA